MFRTTDTVLICVMVGAAAFTYNTKHEAENRYRELRRIESQIRFEEDTINVLKADWSVLTQPRRLQRLTEMFNNELKLEPPDPKQFGELAQIPAKSLDIEDVLDERFGPKVSDPTTTASTKP